MNREIKFRAWFKPLKRMYIVRELKFERNGNIVVITNHNGGTAPINYELMQFTGLKDKKGKEIYEGDIVMVDGRRCKIIFRLGEFTMQQESNKNAYYCIGYHSDCEVIGNIYENPELLKGSN